MKGMMWHLDLEKLQLMIEDRCRLKYGEDFEKHIASYEESLEKLPTNGYRREYMFKQCDLTPYSRFKASFRLLTHQS